jgi:hypothetical protein
MMSTNDLLISQLLLFAGFLAFAIPVLIWDWQSRRRK